MVAFVSLLRSFSENVAVAKTSYQTLGILSFSARERASPPSKEIRVLTLPFGGEKKYNEAFRGVYFGEETRKLKAACKRPQQLPTLLRQQC